MSMFKYVRVVHSPKERRYTVEERGAFSFRWTRVAEYEYVDELNHRPHGPHDVWETAFDRAVTKAETLLAKSVVWQRSNFTWGP